MHEASRFLEPSASQRSLRPLGMTRKGRRRYKRSARPQPRELAIVVNGCRPSAEAWKQAIIRKSLKDVGERCGRTIYAKASAELRCQHHGPLERSARRNLLQRKLRRRHDQARRHLYCIAVQKQRSPNTRTDSLAGATPLWTSGQNVNGPRKRRGEKNVGVEQRAGPRAKMGVPSHWSPGLRPQQRAVRKVGPQGAQAGCTKEMAKQLVVLRAGRDQKRERRRSPKEKRGCVTNNVLHVGRLAPSPWCVGVSACALL